MTQYRLHYAGSTFALKDQASAETVVRQIEEVQSLDAGGRFEVPLADDGSVQVFLSRFVAVAVSAVPERGDVGQGPGGFA